MAKISASQGRATPWLPMREAAAGTPDRPLVSILTTCFNHEPYLDDYVRGLLAQSYDNVELILFDDGSADGSWAKIEQHLPSLQAKFTRVIAERHENIGGPQELVQAIDRATGEFLCVLESDDYYLPTKLEENVAYLVEHPGIGLVHSDVDFVYRDRVELSHWRKTGRHIPTGDVFEHLLLDNFVMTCSFCCRIDLYREHVNQSGYLERGYLAGDWALFLDLARHTRFAYIDKALARYRVRPGSWSRPTEPDGHFRFHRSVLRMRLDYATDARVSPEVAHEVNRDYHRFIYRHGLALGRPEDHREGLRWLRQHYPEHYSSTRHNIAVRLVSVRHFWWVARRIGILKLGWMTWRAGTRLRGQHSVSRPLDLEFHPGVFSAPENRPSAIGAWLSRRVDPHYRGPVLGARAALLRCIPIDRVECPCCGSHFARFISGWRGSVHSCPNCGSHERHRLLWLYLQTQTDLLTAPLRVLHWAPEPGLEGNLRAQRNLVYETADLDPSRATLALDITDIAVPDETYDVIICSHVLEHIQDDRLAMREMLRVLRHGGRAILLVPIDKDREQTYEDPTIIGAEERERAYLDADHFRSYGRDFRVRLEQEGFEVAADRWAAELPQQTIKRHVLSRDEIIYRCTRPSVNRAATSK